MTKKQRLFIYLLPSLAILLCAASTQTNWYSGIKATPYIDVRQFGAIGDDNHDDAPAIQAAMDSVKFTPAGIVVEGTSPNIVTFPPGRFVICSTLHYRRNGMTLYGSGPISVNSILFPPATTLVYGSAGQCGGVAFTGPAIVMDPNDVFLSTGYDSILIVGVGLSNIGISGGGTSSNPAIIASSVSDPPTWTNVRVYGQRNSCIVIQPSFSPQARLGAVLESNGIVLDNFYCTPTGGDPVAPGIYIKGDTDITIRDGRVIAPAAAFATGGTGDVAAIQIESLDYGFDGNGFHLDNAYTANYPVGVRIKGADWTHIKKNEGDCTGTGCSGGICTVNAGCLKATPVHFGPSLVTSLHTSFESWNRAVVIRDESVGGLQGLPSNSIQFGMNNRWYFSYGNGGCTGIGCSPTPVAIQADWVQGGELSTSNITGISYGHINLLSHTNGVVTYAVYDVNSHSFAPTTSISGTGFNQLIPTSIGGLFAQLPVGMTSGLGGIKWFCADCTCTYGAAPSGSGTGNWLYYNSALSSWRCM